MNDSANRSDEELLSRLAAGEESAIPALAERHARGIYDFALRGTQDSDQASDVCLSVFRRIRQAGPTVPGQVDFRTWLYSLALVEVLALANAARNNRVSSEDRRFYYTGEDADTELAHMVWQSARSLRTRDYCVLDLTLRRGLTPEEVADAASLTRSNLYASIGRARGTFEETCAATLLHEYGRNACPILDEIVEGSPGSALRPALRHQISEHADECDACRATLASLPSASYVFVGLPDVVVPEVVYRGIINNVAPTPRAPQSLVPPSRPEAPSPSSVLPLSSLGERGTDMDDEEEDDDRPRREPSRPVPPPQRPLSTPPLASSVPPVAPPVSATPPPPAPVNPVMPEPPLPAGPPASEPPTKPPRLAIFGPEASELPRTSIPSRPALDPWAPPPSEKPAASAAPREELPPETPRPATQPIVPPARAATGSSPSSRVQMVTPARDTAPYDYYDEDEEYEDDPYFTYEESKKGALPLGVAVKQRFAVLTAKARSMPMVWNYALLGVATVVAIYLGVAVADSLRSGGGSSGALPLETTPGLSASQELDCGSDAIAIDHGMERQINFDSDALQGYRIAGVSITPASTSATPNGVQVNAEGNFGIRIFAEEQETVAPRVDQYEMMIDWTMRDRAAISRCQVEVNVTP